MPTYKVPITRIGYSHQEIEVQADSESEALDKAVNVAPNLLFSEKSSEYEHDGSATQISPPVSDSKKIKKQKKSNQVLIHIEGGLVQGVFAKRPIKVIIRDFDIEGSQGDLAEAGTLHKETLQDSISSPGYISSFDTYFNEYEVGAQPWGDLKTKPYENQVSIEEIESWIDSIHDPGSTNNQV